MFNVSSGIRKISLGQCEHGSSIDKIDNIKEQQISPAHHLDTTPAIERASFTLEKEILDDEKDEIVYSSTSNITNDDGEQTSAKTNDNLTNSSVEETTDDDDDDEEDNDGSDNEEERNNGDDDSAIKLDTSKSDSVTEISKATNEKKSFAERKQFLSIDSGHIQSESPSPVDLSPPSSSTSSLNHQMLTSAKSEPMTYSYFRAPCRICGGSTYDETLTIQIGKQYFHKTCLHCYSCEKQLKENEYNYYDLLSDGIYNFYCTLHFCKSRLKQVTTTLATATEQESRSTNIYPNLTQSRSNTNIQWNNNLRLYPSLRDALSHKPHPLNVVNIPNDEKKRLSIGFEQLNQSISNNLNKKISPTLIRSKTFDDTLTIRLTDNDENFNIDTKQSANELSKQRFKRRGRNRPSSPLPSPPSNDCQMILSTNSKQDGTKNCETNSISIINRKKKKILKPQSNSSLSTASSSSTTASTQSLDDDKLRFTDERRQRREERQKELIRFRRSQEIQRELDELEQKRLEIDKRHIIARQNLNSSINNEMKKSYWERECLCMVREKTTLQRTEEELLMAKRGLTLENERARAENEYRQLINLPDEHKTMKDKEHEEQLIRTISKLVEAKNRLTTDLDQMRIRELQEDECLRHAYRLHGIDHQITNFHALDILKDII
ncbi:unnamed protein product [Adineta steineri]|uniref:LIM zinc-binding domain-containing protein n=1 Tax=Adineta steineri TaxID=433720 RepID=A0A813T983_9BILA|nr:unnamed protein product [Adineta steineri]